ncbi:HI0074 family nucleotidyltransferase substrate-binding subunit [Persephonella sp. KM09-Lau-8]|uniref:HI0074 family nucleotidyltransferase substrate-binding subunit n=1 Tax=Persephonella sp. KM09-Lau-8 TaxID=1158345 RepID=UPI0004977C8C|nr:HI0074 family nucleotidyltransferase substrate-binding subunit [Persephonella sp. KM09-Lau-8]
MALKKRLEDFEKAFGRLKESYEETLKHKEDDYYTFFRDSTIQRFEFTVEIMWKTLKNFLYEHSGIDCKSPKGCIRDFFSAGYLTEDETTTLLEMIDDRNMTSHTYHEEVAEKIFKDLHIYLPIIEKILDKLKEHTRNA